MDSGGMARGQGMSARIAKLEDRVNEVASVEARLARLEAQGGGRAQGRAQGWSTMQVAIGMVGVIAVTVLFTSTAQPKVNDNLARIPAPVHSSASAEQSMVALTQQPVGATATGSGGAAASRPAAAVTPAVPSPAPAVVVPPPVRDTLCTCDNLVSFANSHRVPFKRYPDSDNVPKDSQGGYRNPKWTIGDGQSKFADNTYVVEVGGNIGLDTEYYLKRNAGVLHSYEALPELATKLQAKAENWKVRPAQTVYVHPVGVGNATRMETIKVAGADLQSSTLKGDVEGAGTQEITIQIVSFTEHLDRLHAEGKLPWIDLLTINCEGCEYEVMPQLAASAWASRIKRLTVSTHLKRYKLGPEYQQAQCVYQQQLAALFDPTYCNVLWTGWVARQWPPANGL